MNMKSKKRPPAWEPEMDALLGTEMDSKIATMLRSRLLVSPYDVTKRRVALGIPGYRPPQAIWTPEMDALLGKATIEAVALQLGIPESQVHKRMRLLGTKAIGRHVQHVEWNPSRDAVLRGRGTRSLSEIANELGTSYTDVCDRLKEMEPPTATPPGAEDPFEECFYRAAMGESYSSVARLFGVNVEAVRMRVAKVFRILSHPTREIPGEPALVQPERHPSGFDDRKRWIQANRDIYVARLVSRRLSRGADAGIPENWKAAIPEEPFTQPRWTPELDQLLGTRSDASLAKTLNCRPAQVRARRIELKIASFAGGGCDPRGDDR